MMQRNSSASGFCVGCAFLPSSPFSRSPPVQSGSSQSERICRPSFSSFIDIVVEGVALGGLVARRPDQRLVRVGEALALEVRHRVGLAPDDVVQQPEAQVLQRRADAEDVVVAADHPQRALGLQHAARRRQPGAGEGIVARRSRRTCPSRRRRHRPGCCRAAAARRPAADCRAGRRTPCRPSLRAGRASDRCSRPPGRGPRIIHRHRWKMSHPPSPGQEITIDSIVYAIDPQDQVKFSTLPTRPRQAPRRSPCARRALGHAAAVIDHLGDARGSTPSASSHCARVKR